MRILIIFEPFEELFYFWLRKLHIKPLAFLINLRFTINILIAVKDFYILICYIL